MIMKRIYLVVALCMLASFSFAQKKAVKDAKSAMNSNNYDEARALIKPALTDPETANNPETWKIAGDIEYKAFDLERTNEMTKTISGKSADEAKMYSGLYNMYEPYLKSDSLGELPDEKGKVKNKFRKDIAKALKETHPFYINGGLYYNGKEDYNKASEFFERFWIMPSLDIFKDDQEGFKIDSTFQAIKYYAAITSIQAKDHARAIKLLNKMNQEPYIDNSTYKPSDVYELLASEYSQTGDSVNYIAILREGASKFPSNKYFTPNLINEFIRAGKNNEALDYLDQAISNDPTNTCDLKSVKASLYVDQKDYEKAQTAYSEALQNDPNCERALEGIGVLLVIQAQDVKEKAGQTTNRKEQVELDKQTVDLYSKSLPYLEKYRDIVKARNAESKDIRNALMKLQNVYYNLSLLNVDKDNELKQIDADLKVLSPAE